MLALCQHNTLAYYAYYYAGIFDAGLIAKHRHANAIYIVLSTLVKILSTYINVKCTTTINNNAQITIKLTLH